MAPGLADGTITAAVALGAAAHPGQPAEDGALSLAGTVRPVLGLPTARLVLVPLDYGTLPAGSCSTGRPSATPSPSSRSGARRHPRRGQLTIAGGGVTVPPAEQLMVSDYDVRGLALTLAAAESAGTARWCLHTASEYAKVRVQFGRPIGQFQAVKHAPADMLVAVEQSAAVAWDAAAAWSEAGADSAADERPGTATSARASPAPWRSAAADCAKECIQLLGGIGFTWEHDAHLYLKRAMANLQLVAGGDVGAVEHEVAALAIAGSRRNLAADLPPEAESLREEIRAVVAEVAAAGEATGAPPSPRPG